MVASRLADYDDALWHAVFLLLGWTLFRHPIRYDDPHGLGPRGAGLRLLRDPGVENGSIHYHPRILFMCAQKPGANATPAMNEVIPTIATIQSHPSVSTSARLATRGGQIALGAEVVGQSAAHCFGVHQG